MAAQEILSPVIPLNPPTEPLDAQDAALLELTRQLNTERSASRALLATVRELEAALGRERAALAAKEAELTDQRVLMFSIHSDLQDVQRRLIFERDKALWRRVFKR